jgi:hypothetical protein
MKKLLLTTAAMALVSFSAYSQGYVQFVNTTANRMSFGTDQSRLAAGDVAGAFLPTGTRFSVGLYYGVDGPDPGDAGMLGGVMGPSIPVSPLAGRYSGGIRSTPSTTAPGASAWFQVRAWETVFGTSYETAVASGPRDVNGQVRNVTAGKSNRALIVTGSSSTPNPLAGGIGAFGSEIVPEPSTIALGILGGLGTLLLFRRRK